MRCSSSAFRCSPPPQPRKQLSAPGRTWFLFRTLIKDPQGALVFGLEASDFVIEDNGVEQPLRMDEAPEGQPISLVVAIQRGRRASYEFPRMQGLRTMLGLLFELGAARVAIVEFDSQVNLTRDFSERREPGGCRSYEPAAGGRGRRHPGCDSLLRGLLQKEPETAFAFCC